MPKMKRIYRRVVRCQFSDNQVPPKFVISTEGEAEVEKPAFEQPIVPGKYVETKVSPDLFHWNKGGMVGFHSSYGQWI